MAPPTAAQASKKADTPQPTKSAGELSPIAEMNQSLAAAWEQLGYFQRIKLQKATLLRLCELEGMPLSGIDVIDTQQGPRIYINGEGAKYNRDKYLGSQGREVSGRQVDVLNTMPGADEKKDQIEGRKYFKTTTKVISAEMKKIVNAIADGKVAGEIGLQIFNQLAEANTYTSWSAFSYTSEKFQTNRVPEHIIKKGMTQAHRRADLEISKQVVLPMDEEPVDAEFVVHGSPAANAAAAAAGAAAPAPTPTPKGGPSMPAPTTAPAKPADKPVIETTATVKPAAEAAPAAAPTGPSIDSLIGELKNVFETSGVSKPAQMAFMKDNNFPHQKSQMTAEILQKAIAAAREKFAPKPAPTVGAAPSPEEEVERKKKLAAIFGAHEKAGFADEEAVRTWVKATYGKGLSEMTVEETETVRARVARQAAFLGKYQDRGFSSPTELKTWIEESHNATFHDLDATKLDEIEQNLEGSL